MLKICTTALDLLDNLSPFFSRTSPLFEPCVLEEVFIVLFFLVNRQHVAYTFLECPTFGGNVSGYDLMITLPLTGHKQGLILDHASAIVCAVTAAGETGCGFPATGKG